MDSCCFVVMCPFKGLPQNRQLIRSLCCHCGSCHFLMRVQRNTQIKRIPSSRPRCMCILSSCRSVILSSCPPGVTKCQALDFPGYIILCASFRAVKVSTASRCFNTRPTFRQTTHQTRSQRIGQTCLMAPAEDEDEDEAEHVPGQTTVCLSAGNWMPTTRVYILNVSTTGNWIGHILSWTLLLTGTLAGTWARLGSEDGAGEQAGVQLIS